MPIAWPPAELDDARPSFDERARALRPRQPVRDHAQGQGDDQQGDEREPQQDGAAHDAADAQDQHRDRRDGHDHDRVDDALDDDRAKDGRSAQALALTERVGADQFPETGRQDVVREIALVCIAEYPPERDERDRCQQRAPSGATRRDIDQHRDEHQPDPGRARATQHLDRLADVDRAQDEDHGHDTDRDAECTPEDRP